VCGTFGCASVRDVTGLGRFVEWLVMQTEKVIRSEGQRGVCPAVVITELHLENPGAENPGAENLHDGTDLSADKTGIGHVAYQGNHGKEFEISHVPSVL